MDNIKGPSKKTSLKSLMIAYLFSLFILATIVRGQEVTSLQNYLDFDTINKMERILPIPFPTSNLYSNNRMLWSTYDLRLVLGKASLGINSMVLSSEGRFAYVSREEQGSIEVIDLLSSDLETISSIKLKENNYKALVVSSDGNILFASSYEGLKIFTVSDPWTLTLIASIDTKEQNLLYKPSIALSADDKYVFVGGSGLRIFDVSNQAEPKLILDENKEATEIVLSFDKKVLFVAEKTLSIYDVSNPQSISLLNSFTPQISLVSIILSPDGKTLYGVGQLDDKTTYEVIDVTDSSNPKTIKNGLPKHSLDQDSRPLAVSPDGRLLYLSNPLKILNLEAYEFLPNVPREIKDATSIAFSLDDSNIFFVGTDQEFMAARFFSDTKSLIIKTEGNKIMIEAPQKNYIKISIKIDPSNLDNPARFVMKDYPSILPTLYEAKSGLFLEGSLEDILKTLENIVVDFPEPNMNIDASITVSDEVNPSTSERLINISSFFKSNEPPQMKKNIQEQINTILIYPGKHFEIELAHETFVSKYEVYLDYKIAMPNENDQIPEWLHLSWESEGEPVIVGEPPVNFSQKSIDLVFVVQSDGKELRVPFTLNIQVSSSNTLIIIGICAVIVFILIAGWYVFTKRKHGASERGYDEKRLLSAEQEFL